jgi:hypothetical protein
MKISNLEEVKQHLILHCVPQIWTNLFKLGYGSLVLGQPMLATVTSTPKMPGSREAQSDKNTDLVSWIYFLQFQVIY